jgi:hypothetical protein
MEARPGWGVGHGGLVKVKDISMTRPAAKGDISAEA